MSIPSINTGNTKLDHMLAEWFRLDKNEKTIAETKALLEKNDIRELESRFLVRMEFGTAGLRARMAAGYACMNDLTIIQSGQGLLKYLESTVPNLRTAGFVVGYDARHNSRRFAELTASIFLHADVPVYMFRQISPTPFVPYAVLRYKCACGVMVTASHNPKEDNGYKVYWGNGSQIISPHDKGISQNIDKHLDPFPTSWDTSPVSDNSPLLKEPFDDVMDAYFKDMDAALSTDKEACARTSIKFTYTAMHGVGYEFSLKSAHTFGLSTMIPVVEQVQPDPDFPTVKFPNPEEGKSALELAIKTANANESTVILANDPDADRLAVAEKKPDGAWKVFTGNELGALFGWYSWYAYRKTHPDVNADNVYMLASTVSSKIIAAIARKEGFHFEETLTGFKWMGNRSDELLRAGKTVLFAFEEAIGFMCGVKVLDKDGVSALGVIIEMASILKEQGFTLQQKLEDIYMTYGLHISRNSYFLCYDPHVIQALFDRLRNYGGANQYPTQCGPFQIKSIRDLTTGFDNSRPDNKAVLPSTTMRTSGTEPKIKYYTELCGEPGKGREELQNELNQLVASIVEHFYEPEKNGITPQAD